MRKAEIENLEQIGDENGRKILSESNYIKIKAAWLFLNPMEALETTEIKLPGFKNLEQLLS